MKLSETKHINSCFFSLIPIPAPQAELSCRASHDQHLVSEVKTERGRLRHKNYITIYYGKREWGETSRTPKRIWVLHLNILWGVSPHIMLENDWRFQVSWCIDSKNTTPLDMSRHEVVCQICVTSQDSMSFRVGFFLSFLKKYHLLFWWPMQKFYSIYIIRFFDKL